MPARDEEERIGRCLSALACQRDSGLDRIIVVVNDTTDRTGCIIGELVPTLPVPVTVIDVQFGPEQGSAGTARRLGMERGAALLEEGGVLLTTDADAVVPADWVAANLHHLRLGVDAVAGRFVLEPDEWSILPERMRSEYARECHLAAALDALALLLHPEPWDPAPRHTHHSGASIAVTLAAYRRVGGMPQPPISEDRLFFDALRRNDQRIRHAPDIAVIVSARAVGRARDGMADWIRRRMSSADQFADADLEPARLRARRLLVRHRFYKARHERDAEAAAALGRRTATPLRVVQAALAHPHAGEGWAMLQLASPVLHPVLVRSDQVHAETMTALRLGALLRRSVKARAG